VIQAVPPWQGDEGSLEKNPLNWRGSCEREASKYRENVFYIKNYQNTKYSCKIILNTSVSTSVFEIQTHNTTRVFTVNSTFNTCILNTPQHGLSAIAEFPVNLSV